MQVTETIQVAANDKSSVGVKPLRLLILGGGAVVSEFYLPALERLGWTTGITVADPSTMELSKLKTRAPWLSTREASFENALAEPGIQSHFDFVVVALPNSLHTQAVLAAFNAGLPVLCEKPLALSVAECELLSSATRERELQLVVGMVRRLTPAAKAAQQAFSERTVGPLKRVTVDHGAPYGWVSETGAFFRRENGGILADLGVHHLDWLELLFGPLKPIAYRDDARGGVEASCSYELETSTGVPISLNLSYRHQRSNTTVFECEDGDIVLDRDKFESCWVRSTSSGIESELKPAAPFSDPSWENDFVSCFAQQFYDLSASLQDKTLTGPTAGEATSTMRLIQEAYDSRSITFPPSDHRPQLTIGRTVVTGGSGFIGTALIERLTGCGFDELVVPVRQYRTAASVARFPVELPRIDLTSRDQVRELVKGARWVFHLAYGQTPSDAKRITIDATRLLVEEAAAAGVEAVVVLSTMYVFGHPKTTQLVDESWPYAPTGDDYGKTKVEMEKWCLRNADKFGSTRLVVLNPSCVYGPEGKTYTRLPEELARRGEFAWVDEGSGLANFTYIDNLIDAILFSAAEPGATGQRFIVNDGTCTWREFLAPLLSSSPDKLRSYSVPEFEGFEKEQRTRLSHVGRSLLNDQVLRNWFKEQKWFRPFVQTTRSQMKKRPAMFSSQDRNVATSIPPSWLANLFGPTSTRFSSEKLSELGWKPLVNLEEGQRRTREWLLEMGFLKLEK